MNKKITRKLVVTGLAAVIGICGLSGSSALAAETYQPVSIKSYGAFSYDDGNAGNNKGYKYDIFLDSSDLTKLNDNMNVLKLTSDNLTTQISNVKTEVTNLSSTITNIAGSTQDISNLKNDVSNLKNRVSTLEGNYNNLNSSVSKLTTDVASCFQSVSDGKALLASTLTDLGVETASDATFETIDNNIKQLATSKAFTGTVEYIYHHHDSSCGSGKCGGSQKYYSKWTESNGSTTAQYKCEKCGHIYTYSNVSATPDVYGKCIQGGSYKCGYSEGEIIGATITY